MLFESKDELNKATANTVMRTTSLKPRLDYAIMLVDKTLESLNQDRLEIRRFNQSHYEKSDKNLDPEFKKNLDSELKISRALESLRQTRRCMDSVFGLGNIVFVLAPTISIIRTIRSQLFGMSVNVDFSLGELSLVLGGLIIDAGHLTGASLDFEEANRKSCFLLDEAKLIADSKISKQFPNVDFL